jgi:hypothetical protein
MDMNTKSSSQEIAGNRAMRLWPGVSLAIAMLIISYVIPKLIPNAEIIGIFGGLILGLGIIIWWAFFSRAPKFERWIAILLMIAALFMVSQFNRTGYDVFYIWNPSPYLFICHLGSCNEKLLR